jgi:hypothetical protein
MHPIRFTLASLACVAGLGAPAALADELCDKVDALILSGQQDVSFADVSEPRPNALRNDEIRSGDALLGLFTKCTLVDEVDNAGRNNSTLTCSVTENNGEPVTEASRAGFIANELGHFEDISVCIAAKDGWFMYGDVSEGKFESNLNDWAETRPEDGINAELSVLQIEDTPLVNAQLVMQLWTNPRDPS